MKTKEFRFEKKENPIICDLIFRLFLKINNAKFNQLECSSHRVYDHLGVIDTLGHNVENGRFTFHYSDELGCVFAIRFMGLQFSYYDF